MKILNYLNGHKTIIGQSLLIILLIFQKQINPELFTGLASLIGLWTGASLVHHVKKSIKDDTI
jgi:uncharacterized membrane protein YfcA